MTREELWNTIKAARCRDTIDSAECRRLWRQAFNEYGRTHGVNLSLKCNKCFDAVKEWLEK